MSNIQCKWNILKLNIVWKNVIYDQYSMQIEYFKIKCCMKESNVWAIFHANEIF